MKKYAIILSALAVGLLAPAAKAAPAPCGEAAADYQYAWPEPAAEVFTATVLTCRTDAPWVLLIHGGSWINGNRDYMTGQATAFYERGWQTFNMEYRRGLAVSWVEQEDDLKAAYDYIVRHAALFHLDPRRGTVYGFSAGGHMAAWLGSQRPASSVVSVSGVLQPQRLADDSRAMRPTAEPDTPDMTAVYQREEYMMGCGWDGAMATDCEARWRDFLPETYAASSPPTYVLQGDDDVVLPYPMPDAYAYHLRAAGVPAVVEHVPGYGHDPHLLFDDLARLHRVLTWVVDQWPAA